MHLSRCPALTCVLSSHPPTHPIIYASIYEEMLDALFPPGADLTHTCLLSCLQVVRLLDYGAIIALPTGLQTLLHISELSHTRIRDVRDVIAEGQRVQVWCKEAAAWSIKDKM